MAKFEAGKTGNPAGRPAGAKNKAVPVTRDELTRFLNDEWPGVKRDFRKLEPVERIEWFIRLAELREKMNDAKH